MRPFINRQTSTERTALGQVWNPAAPEPGKASAHRHVRSLHRARTRRPVHRRRLGCEMLEDRRLLSGVTLLFHGADTDAGLETWVEHIDDAIASRSENAVVLTARVVDADNPHVDYVVQDSGPVLWSDEHTTGEVIYKIDWSRIAFDSGVSTGMIADVVAEYLLNPSTGGQVLAESPLHLIGHSRGGSVVAELARLLGEAGVWVDHVTTLDPHPVDGVNEPFPYPDFGDAPMTAWESVVFWDNYWRTDGDHSFDFTGEPVANTYSRQLAESRLEQGGYGGFPSGGEHSDVHLWYHGTIDTSEDPPANDGVYDVPNDWYDGSHPSRTASGYAFSRVASGARDPDGLSHHLGGNAVRASMDWTDATWPNLLDLQVATAQTSFVVGEPVPVAYSYHDVDSDTTLDFFFDADRNPYNAGAVPAGPSYVLPPTPGEPGSQSVDVPSAGVGPGTYYVSAALSDSVGRVRWLYTPAPITLDPAPAEVVARHVFYNNSKWDESPGNPDGDPAANEYDDNAIAPDKTALLPGETATFQHYTSYSRGINGIMINIAGLADGENLTAADFTFRMGNDDSPAAWPLAPTPANESTTVRPGEGVGASDRVTLIWPDYDPVNPDPATQAVAKQWLQVTVLNTANTGLAEPDVFYFGNALGDSGTGNFGGAAPVNAVDSGAVRDNPHNPFVNPAPLDDFADYDRDQWVNAVDFGFVRDNATNPVTALRLITAPAVGSPTGPEGAAAARIDRGALHDAAMADPGTERDGLVDSEPHLPELSWLDGADLPGTQGRSAKVVDPAVAAVEELLATL